MKRISDLFLILFTIFFVVFLSFNTTRAAQKTLDIYFIDVEGGAATLIVTPLGESLLVDTGYPEDRDAARIAHVAFDVAGIKQIDHCIITHWHRDHVGGVVRLAKLIPIKHYYDRGLLTKLGPDIPAELIEAYRQTTNGTSTVLKPLDQIKFRTNRSFAPLQVRILAVNSAVVGEQPGAPQIRPCGPDFKPAPEDTTDNVNSVGLLLTFGEFRFFDGGDLTMNMEHKLVCPKNLVGVVDVYQVDHHGMDSSNNPALVRAINPQVAIIDSGPRKGAEARTFATLKSVPQIDIYQLHRNVRTTANDNALPAFVANDEENCQGNFIKLSVSANGRAYSVSIPAKNITLKYQVNR